MAGGASGMARLLALSIALLVVGCQPSDRSTGKLRVATSVVPHAWLVRQIGDDHVDVTSVVAPNESPHTYQPTDAQVSRIMASAVYFRVGISFENGPWFKAIQSAKRPRIVDLRQGVPLREMTADERHADEAGHREAENKESHDKKADDKKADDHGQEKAHAGHAHAEHEACAEDGRDPHIWLSPRLLKIQATTIATTLAEIDREHAAFYQANLRALDKRLDELDQKLRKLLEPVKGKGFFVFHPAWGYFAQEYGLHQIAIEIEGKEPSDKELTSILGLAREAHVKVIFVQPQITGRAAQAVAAAIGARVQVADPLAEDLPAELTRLAEALAKAN